MMLFRLFPLRSAARLLGVSEERLAAVAASAAPMRHVTPTGEPAYDFYDIVVLRRVRQLLRSPLLGDALLDAVMRGLAAPPIAHRGAVVPLRMRANVARARAASAAAYRAELRGDARAAEQAYRAALKHDGACASAWCGLGRLLAEADYLDEALECLSHASAIEPDSAGTARLIGRVHMLRDEPKEAAVALARAANLDPDDADAHRELARCLDQLGEHERARVHWSRSFALSRGRRSPTSHQASAAPDPQLPPE